tara:strand:+ start:2438 stop:2929 length:492 start_codon:yes stop_codon:yes gene_type:complete
MTTSSSRIIGIAGLIKESGQEGPSETKGAEVKSGYAGGKTKGKVRSKAKAKGARSAKYVPIKGVTADVKPASIKGGKKPKPAKPGKPGKPSKSDRVLKENIDLVGKSNSGINIYEFDYKDKSYGEGRYRGVMAQEVPNASSTGNDGYLEVDYSKIDVDFKRID